MNCSRIGAATLLAATLLTGAHAQVLLQWNTFGNTGLEVSESSVFNDPNLLAAPLLNGAGINTATNANRLGGSSWFDTGDTNPTSLDEAIADNDYFQFTVTPVAGASFTATSFVFSWERSGTGPSAVTLRSSLDDFAADLGSLTGLTTALSTGNTITLTGVENVSAAVTFRLYGWAATAVAGSGGFDTATNAVNVQLNGLTAAIPEPATYAALLAAGTLAVVAWRRRGRGNGS